MALPIDTLIRSLTGDECLEILLASLEGVKIPARSWRPGGTAKALLGVIASVGSVASVAIAGGIRGGFLEYAGGGWLTLLARLVYGVTRKAATFAQGRVTLVNQGSTVYTWGADELVLYSSVTGARFKVSTPAQGTLDFPALAANGSLTVDVVAIAAGAAGSVAPGQIDKFETILAKVVCGNESAIVGAAEESDPELAVRCLMRVAVLSKNGPRGAYEFACLSALLPGGAPTSINRCIILPELGDGTVRAVCATPTGAPTVQELKAVRDLIEDAARTDTDTVVLSGAVNVPFSKLITIWRKGGDESVVRANAISALIPLFATYPIGGLKKSAGASGYLYADAIESAVISSSPGVIFDVDQDSGDLALAYNEVPVVATSFLVRVAA